MKKILIVAMVALFGLSFVGISTALAGEDCEKSPGYWKNHPEAWPATVWVGGIEYTYDEAIVFMGPVKGDKSLTLFKAALAANLNVNVRNCDPPPPFPECTPLTTCWGQTCEALDQAFLWLNKNQPGSNIRGNSDDWQFSHGEDIYLCLDNYNNGLFN